MTSRTRHRCVNHSTPTSTPVTQLTVSPSQLQEESRGLGSIPGLSMRNFWLIKCHWDGCISQCHIHPFLNDVIYNFSKRHSSLSYEAAVLTTPQKSQHSAPDKNSVSHSVGVFATQSHLAIIAHTRNVTQHVISA